MYELSQSKQDRKTEIKLESLTRSANHGASGHHFLVAKSGMNSLVHSQAQQKQFEVGWAKKGVVQRFTNKPLTPL